MPTKTKPKTKTTITAVNRRKSQTKRKHRSWIWWTIFLVPIALSVWLFAEPVLNEAKMALKTTSSIERVESSTEMRSRRPTASAPSRSQPTEQPDEGVINEDVKDDVDWALGHMYKLFPLVLSLIALLKRDKLLGRRS